MPFFQGMDSECVRTLVSYLGTQHFIGSDVVARESDVCLGCYYLCAGSVALVTHATKVEEEEEESKDFEHMNVKKKRGEGKIENIIKQGDLLGEESLLREWRWTHTIQVSAVCASIYECICSGGTFVAQVDDEHWTLAGIVVLRSADPTTS
jgi:hypothetical protein